MNPIIVPIDNTYAYLTLGEDTFKVCNTAQNGELFDLYCEVMSPKGAIFIIESYLDMITLTLKYEGIVTDFHPQTWEAANGFIRAFVHVYCHFTNNNH